ncbi:MAG TPA: hemerythrin domain-containing protein [Thermoanaerobaculia bacterium]|nr:hemerythrin domain-containing protein [Thermoanaerobaculia bacterium]
MTLFQEFVREHRELDELFGRFLAAVHAEDAEGAAAAIAEFDDRLRSHTAREDETVFVVVAGEKLLEREAEDESARRFRQLRLEHVQVREVTGMIRRLLSEKADLEGARRLAPNLARRWDAHTTREEREVFASGG